MKYLYSILYFIRVKKKKKEKMTKKKMYQNHNVISSALPYNFTIKKFISQNYSWSRYH